MNVRVFFGAVCQYPVQAGLQRRILQGDGHILLKICQTVVKGVQVFSVPLGEGKRLGNLLVDCQGVAAAIERQVHDYSSPKSSSKVS